MISLYLLALVVQVSPSDKIPYLMGPSTQVYYEAPVSWRGIDYKMTLLALSHGYSAYDRAQLNGQLPDTESLSGVLTLKSASTPSQQQSLPVVGRRQGKKFQLRPIEIFQFIKDRQLTSEDIKLWMESKSAALQEDREIEFELAAGPRKSSDYLQFGGYARIDGSAILAEFDQSAQPALDDLYLGMLSIAWPYRARNEFSESSDKSEKVTIQKVWNLGRALEAQGQSTLEADLRQISPTLWAPLSEKVFGRELSIDSVIEAAKRLADTQRITDDFEPKVGEYDPGELENAFGCAAAQAIFFPMIGRKLGDSMQWVTAEWNPQDPKIFRFRVLTTKVADSSLKGETFSEQYEPGAPAYRNEGRMKLKALK